LAGKNWSNVGRVADWESDNGLNSNSSISEPHSTRNRPPRSDRSFTFERHLSKALGGTGYADVWKRNFFAWEYKGPHNISDSSGATISNVAVLVATNLL
jgi:hypothetical protein